MKKFGLSFIAATLLLALTGCGSKLDVKSLSDDGGVYRMDYGDSYDVVQFDSDGEGTLYENKKGESSEKIEYSVTESDQGYKLKIKRTEYDEKITIEIPKENNDAKSFTGIAEDDDYEDEKTVYHFTKEKPEYLED